MTKPETIRMQVRNETIVREVPFVERTETIQLAVPVVEGPTRAIRIGAAPYREAAISTYEVPQRPDGHISAVPMSDADVAEAAKAYRFKKDGQPER
jgi:hypothetical protein